MVKKILLIILAVLLLSAGGFVAWGSTPYPPHPEAVQALESSAAVQVFSPDSGEKWLVFQPQTAPAQGYVFYPGGRVDARAYAPYARALAEKGILVVIPQMPLNLAVLDPDAAGRIIAAYPDVTVWSIGGHSLGGAMAARYAAQNPGRVSGLALLAAYPAESDSLNGSRLQVLSIYAENDGLATQAKIDASKALLPKDARFVKIAGGNHAGFGWYGPQDGDGTASISQQQQQARTVEATLGLFSQLEKAAE